jgi:uncharacterized protein (DUF488 family)
VIRALPTFSLVEQRAILAHVEAADPASGSLAMTDLGSLWTLGYAGMTSHLDLAELLDGTGVDIVVDVRLQPFGRAPFNGPAATRALVESVGPTYRWDQRLGNLAYKTGGTRIKDIEAIEDVLAELRAGGSVALLCVCPNPITCHRLTLAEEAIRRMPGLPDVHLSRTGRSRGA